MGPFFEPFHKSALQFARFVAHVLLIAGMRLVIEQVSEVTGFGLTILEWAENAAIAVAAIRSFRL